MVDQVGGLQLPDPVALAPGLPSTRTDLPPHRARIRGHWQIDNGLHWVRDVTFGGDLSQIRTGAAPQTMATLRIL